MRSKKTDLVFPLPLKAKDLERIQKAWQESAKTVESRVRAVLNTHRIPSTTMEKEICV